MGIFFADFHGFRGGKGFTPPSPEKAHRGRTNAGNRPFSALRDGVAVGRKTRRTGQQGGDMFLDGRVLPVSGYTYRSVPG